MRLFVGLVLGAVLTVALAYLHDTYQVPQAPAEAHRQAARTLVNWDVAAARWNETKAGLARLGREAQDGFERLAGR
jgi:hypothetical protein